jgi:signal transduction histidine kinase
MVDMCTLVEDSLRMNEGAISRHGITLVREFHKVPPIVIDKHKVLQILVNVIRNAKYACDESPGAEKRVTVRVSAADATMLIAVIDTGVGIPPENLGRIFSHGFTTRKDGHGFGLHSCALAAKELGGSLLAQSDGPGHGATFILTLPLTQPEPPHGR